MPKTPSSKLFDIIKSLSGPEKRYFKLFVRSNKSDKDNKYIQLFDAIDAQASYDDEALRHQIYDGQPIQSRKFSELKSYLYELILKSLQSYDEKSSVDYRLKSALQSIKALYKRAHYQDCTELVHKAKKIAAEFESYNHLLELLRWEKQVAYIQLDISYLDKSLPGIEAEERECLKKLANIADYKNFFYHIIVSIRKDSLLRSEEKIEKLNKLIDHDLLRTPDNALSHTARVLYHRIYGLYYFSILSYDKLYQSGKELLKLMETRPVLLREDPSEYISALSNFAACCGLLRKYDEVKDCLEKLRKIKGTTLNDELRIHIEYYSKLFALYIFTGDFEAARKAMLIHQKELKRFDRKFFERGRFYFQYFYIYFGIGDYDQALEALNQWLNLPRTDERQDLQSLARILNLILHFEMGNTLLLEYLLRSTYRYLRTRNRIHGFERRVLAFIRESNKFRSRQELKAGFIRLKEDFEELSRIPSERVVFQYFDFIAWLESKINNQSFGKAVQERYLAQEQG
ncbi:MAG: hypothetical protein AAF990_05735 [Bacteroidota bacterium]